jgi:type IV secretory pathway VirB2 component (pilin)
MDLGKLKEPRFAIAVFAIIAILALALLGDLSEEQALMAIIGILVAFGAYLKSPLSNGASNGDGR